MPKKSIKHSCFCQYVRLLQDMSNPDRFEDSFFYSVGKKTPKRWVWARMKFLSNFLPASQKHSALHMLFALWWFLDAKWFRFPYKQLFLSFLVFPVLVLDCNMYITPYIKNLNFKFVNFQSKHIESSQFLEGLFASRHLMEKLAQQNWLSELYVCYLAECRKIYRIWQNK